MQTKRLLFGCLAFLALAPGVARAEPVTVANPVADVVDGQGTGLCAAAAISSNPTEDFGLLDPSGYTEHINTFIDAHKADRVESVSRSLLDLSNNDASGVKLSYGDFINATPDCKEGGCDFLVDDKAAAFGTRLRGFFNVTADLANKPIHFGFYTDDAVSLTIYDKALVAHPVIIRAPAFGAATWRVTNEVTFAVPGLYPLEILHIQITEHAALEMSYFVGDFDDFDRPANQIPIVKLNEAGFTLFQPTSFFQALSGVPSYPDLAACKQCEWQFVNTPGNNGCDAGYYCNEAALCSPCDNSKFCGATCSPCGVDTPFCANVNGNLQCAGCLTDADCASGSTCDSTTKACNESPSPAGAGGSGGSGGGGSSGSGGSGGGGISVEGGCGCRVESNSSRAGSAGLLGLAVMAMGFARSRRRVRVGG